jgi:hypothetical protein
LKTLKLKSKTKEEPSKNQNQYKKYYPKRIFQRAPEQVFDELIKNKNKNLGN